jgi:uncharacterized membrane protein
VNLKELINQEEVEIKNMECLVSKVVEDENILATKLHAVESDDEATFGQKISDKVADFGGSWTFILGFGFFIVIWITYNSVMAQHNPADPYPYILLNLMLSCLAAFQAPIIMMSQNRQEEKDRRRARSDYMINLKAELEIRSLHEKIDLFQKTHDELIKKLSEKNLV